MTASEITARHCQHSFDLVHADTAVAIRLAQSIRYRACVASGVAAPSLDGRLTDPFDGHPDARIYLLRAGRHPLGTIRLGLGALSADSGSASSSVARVWFGPDVLSALPRGALVIEAAHLAVEPAQSDGPTESTEPFEPTESTRQPMPNESTVPTESIEPTEPFETTEPFEPIGDSLSLAVHDRLLESALSAALVHEADAVLFSAWRRHVVFYRRQWHMQRLSPSRRIHGLSAEQCLLILPRGPAGLDRVLAQRPWLWPTEGDTGALVLRRAADDVRRLHTLRPMGVVCGDVSYSNVARIEQTEFSHLEK